MQTTWLLIWTNQLVKDNCRKVINYASCDKDMMDIFLYVYIKSHIYIIISFKKLRSWYPVPSLHGQCKEKKWKQ